MGRGGVKLMVMRSHRLIFVSLSVLACSGETVGTGTTDIGNGGESVENNCVQFTVDCDGLIENGCETNTLTDIENCGGCGIICGEGYGTPYLDWFQWCVKGECGFTPCDVDTGDCDGDGTCETNINTSNDCGSCGNVCDGGSSCINKTCN